MNSSKELFKFKKDAVPTLFEFTPQVKERRKSSWQLRETDETNVKQSCSRDNYDSTFCENKVENFDEVITVHDTFQHVGINTYSPDEIVSFYTENVISYYLDSTISSDESRESDKSYERNSQSTVGTQSEDEDSTSMKDNRLSTAEKRPHKEDKYIVFMSSLLLLPKNCLVCNCPAYIQ